MVVTRGAFVPIEVVDDFLATPGTLPDGYALARASDGSYIDAAGDLQIAAANAARWTYNPTTLALQGLLNEPERTNLKIESESALNGANEWIGVSSTITPDVADSLLGRAAGRVQNVTASQNVNMAFPLATIGGSTLGRTWVASAYVINNGGFATIRAQMRLAGGAVALQAIQTLDFNMTTVARLQQFLQANANDRNSAQLLVRSTAAQTYDLFCGLAQIEEIPEGQERLASSWIPTTASSATRARDVLTRTGLWPGVYNVRIARLNDREEVILGQDLSDGSFEVPPSVYPIQSIRFEPVTPPSGEFARFSASGTGNAWIVFPGPYCFTPAVAYGPGTGTSNLGINYQGMADADRPRFGPTLSASPTWSIEVDRYTGLD